MPSLAWLAAGLCATTAPAGPTVDMEVAVSLADRTLQGRAVYELPGGTQRLTWHPALQVRQAKLDGKALNPGDAPFVIETERPGQLDITWSLELAPLDTAIDHRGVLTANAPMAGGGFAWLPAAAGWYPQPAEGLAAYTVRITSDAGEAVTAGERVAADAPSAASSGQFVHSYPVAGIDLLIGPWQVQSRSLALPSGGTVEVATYFTAAIAPLASDYLDSAATQISAYDALIGAYPFERFAIVASPLPSGFGMPGMTWLGEQVLRLPFIRATSLRHEVLHNWWGNGVRVDYARGNWSEGLTTLMADFATREEESEQAARDQRLDWVRSLLAVPAGETVSLRDFRFREHGRLAAVGYAKAAFVFWMLRERLGAEIWRKGLGGFWSACQHRQASWDDLQQAFEDAAGSDLEDAFHPWLESTSLPTPRIVSARQRADARMLEIKLTQASPVHHLTLPVAVRTDSGTETYTLRLTAESSTVQLVTSRPALGVTLDPALTVLREPPPRAVPPILRNALLARSPDWRVLSDEPAWREAAAALAAAFFERSALERPAGQPAQDDADAHLIAGPAQAVVTLATTLGLIAQRPAALDGEGEARVWTARDSSSAATWVFVETADASALAALARPLPHYGAAGWLLLAGGRAVARGSAAFDEPEVPVATALEAATRP
jgi:aminopeptidase N